MLDDGGFALAPIEHSEARNVHYRGVKPVIGRGLAPIVLKSRFLSVSIVTNATPFKKSTFRR